VSDASPTAAKDAGICDFASRSPVGLSDGAGISRCSASAVRGVARDVLDGGNPMRTIHGENPSTSIAGDRVHRPRPRLNGLRSFH
jgi:hypothetical protein